MNAVVDLNGDVGEGVGHDAAFLPLLTSANVACGAHAGDPATMRATVELALRHGVAIGAHPGYADREHFGRRELALPAPAVRELVRCQVAALDGLGPVRHVKLHGALYNQAARDPILATAAVDAVLAVRPNLVLFAPPGSALVRAGEARGLRVALEFFADRTYEPDGSLTPRARPGAVIHDAGVAVARALRMIREGRVGTTDGTDLRLRADTICLHGDGPDPAGFARRLRAGLLAAGIGWQAPFAEP